MTHLWEIDHAYYGAEGYLEEVESFEALREMVDSTDEDLNHVYRWDWKPAKPEWDQEETFHVFMVLPRKNQFWSLSCPISRDQEDEVLEFLKSDRVFGALREMWAPLIGGSE